LLQPAVSHAATILEMSLGAVTPDIQFNGTSLSTMNDGNGTSLEDQDTSVLFLGFLDPLFADILNPPPMSASFSITGLVPDGGAQLIAGSIILQNFKKDATFVLRDASNVTLLSGKLGTSALTGALGNSTGGLFQTTVGEATGGSLLPYINPGSVAMSMNFTSIVDTASGTPGLRVSPLPPPGPPPFSFATTLLAFTADATANIEATIPEPAGLTLLVVGGALGLVGRRRAA
jgi:hypothetical protein